MGVVLIGLLVCCAAGYFVGLPALQENVRDDIADALSTEVSEQVSVQLPDGQVIEAGTYRISIVDIENQIEANLGQGTVEELSIRADGQEIVFTVGSGGQSIEYRGTPDVENGDLVMRNMQGGGVLDWFLPADTLGDSIEMAVNTIFGQQGLEITSLRLEGDELVLEAEETAP